MNINSLPDGGSKLKALIDKLTSQIYELDRKIKAAVATLPQGKIIFRFCCFPFGTDMQRCAEPKSHQRFSWITLYIN